MNDSFVRGFRKALQLFKAGQTLESISNSPAYDASAFGRGLFASIEAMGGWYDVAEREARAWGFTREEAARLAREAEPR